jgi:hypothetical protein
MHILFFLLAMLALCVLIAVVTGTTLKVVGLWFLAALVVAAMSWIMRNVRGSNSQGIAMRDDKRPDRRSSPDGDA